MSTSIASLRHLVLRSHRRGMWMATSTMVALLLALQTSLLLTAVTAYIPSTVPVERQLKFLKDMTSRICQVQPGQLSSHQLSQAPELMHAWSRRCCSRAAACGDKKECAMAVEALVKRLIDERRAGNPAATRLELTVHDYNCLLEGWARSGLGHAAAERCEQILEGMQQQGPRPNLKSFKTLLAAWRQAAEGGTDRNNHNRNQDPFLAHDFVPQRAQRILEWMIRLHATNENQETLPDADCFDRVLQLWSHSAHPAAAFRAEQLIIVMERLYKTVSAEAIMDENDHSSSLRSASKLKPRTTSFNAVMYAWSKVAMESPPTISTTKHTQPQRRSEKSLSANDDSISDHFASSAVDATDRVLAILNFMESQAASLEHPDGGVHCLAPDRVTYTTVLKTLHAQTTHPASWAARQADHLLRRAEKVWHEQHKAQQQGNEEGKDSSSMHVRYVPDTLSYNTALSCWARAAQGGSVGAYRKAQALLERQVALYESGCDAAQPDVFGYTSVMAACAAERGSSREKRKAFDVAVQIFQQQQQQHQKQLQQRYLEGDQRQDSVSVTSTTADVSPNHVTYGTMLKACCRLLPSHPAPATESSNECTSTAGNGSSLRHKWARQIFEQCRAQGLVGDMVLSRLREASPDLYRYYMQGITSRTKLPASWTRNVHETNQIRLKRSRSSANQALSTTTTTRSSARRKEKSHDRSRRRGEI